MLCFSILKWTQFLRWSVTLRDTCTRKNPIYNLEFIFHLKLFRKNTTFIIILGFWAVFYLDLNIILVMNSHTDTNKKNVHIYYHLGMIFHEKLYRKKHSFIGFLPILAVFHIGMNLFFVMNSHTKKEANYLNDLLYPTQGTPLVLFI